MKYALGEELKIEVEELGAEPVSIRFAGKERLWQNENGAWAGHAPVLFPVCGHFGVTVGGKTYPAQTHGFARKRHFRLSERGADYLEFLLVSNGATKENYPFDFELTVRYTIKDNALAVSYGVRNTGREPLYFACGGHPSFALEGEIGEYFVEFDRATRLIHHAHDDGGYLSGERTDFGTVKSLPLREEYFVNGSTLIFAGIGAKKATLKKNTGEKVAEVSFADYENLLLWKCVGGKMLCIEPWSNLPDTAGGEEIEFSHKAGVSKVLAGECAKRSYTIAYF